MSAEINPQAPVPLVRDSFLAPPHPRGDRLRFGGLTNAPGILTLLASFFATAAATRADLPCVNWSNVTPLRQRQGHAMAYDNARGVTVLFGGDNGNVTGSTKFYRDTSEWNGVNWIQRAPMTGPPARAFHAMAYDSARGVTVLFGGLDFNVSPYVFGDTWEWNGTTWTQRNPMTSPLPRYSHAMAYDSARGVTVLFGGGFNFDDTWEWNGTDWTQRSPAVSPAPGGGHAMCFDSARGVTVLFGGGNSGDTWEWNGTDWTHPKPATSPHARGGHAMTYDSARGVTVLFGGTYYDANVQYYFSDTWAWNGTAWSRYSPPNSPTGRTSHAMAYDGARGETVLFDGYYFDGGDQFPGDTWAWNGSNWTKRGAAASPPPRTDHAMAFDTARAVTVLFGVAGNEPRNRVWEWGGTTWAQRTPPIGPHERYGHKMAYDSARSVTVLFGGRDINPLGDTWEWDGGTWTQRSPATSPSARNGHAMAYDSVRGVTMLFGGTLFGTNDTWEWNGMTWTQRNSATRPTGREQHAMAFDSARGVIVLFGGYVFNGGNYLSDTWEWNGTNWLQRAPATSPSARQDHAMAYDSVRGVTVLFGGMRNTFSGFFVFGDTWDWNGTNWTQRSPETGPSARYGHAMAYDSARGVSVMFGGQYSDIGGIHRPDDTWEFGSVGPPTVTQQPANPTPCIHGVATFTVSAAGTAPLAYQWRRNSVNLVDGDHVSGATSATLILSHMTSGDRGTYDVVVTDACGSVTSGQARLGICPEAVNAIKD